MLALQPACGGDKHQHDFGLSSVRSETPRSTRPASTTPEQLTQPTRTAFATCGRQWKGCEIGPQFNAGVVTTVGSGNLSGNSAHAGGLAAFDLEENAMTLTLPSTVACM